MQHAMGNFFYGAYSLVVNIHIEVYYCVIGHTCMLPEYYSQLRDTDNEFNHFIQMLFYQ